MDIKVITDRGTRNVSLKLDSLGQRQFEGALKKALRLAGICIPAGAKIQVVQIRQER